MFDVTQEERNLITREVCKILQTTNKSQKKILVPRSRLLDYLDVPDTKPSEAMLIDVIHDVLESSSIRKQFGVWAFLHRNKGFWTFLHVSNHSTMEELIESCDFDLYEF